MQQNISIFIDYLVYKDNSNKKYFTEYSFAAMDTNRRCYRFVEIVTKPPRVQCRKTICM
jgi:Asp-tRNA(Asn)/Glu-tRNA(Gln) amidotransferase B subunit